VARGRVTSSPVNLRLTVKESRVILRVLSAAYGVVELEEPGPEHRSWLAVCSDVL